MFPSVVVGADGSPTAGEAFRYAWISSRCRAGPFTSSWPTSARLQAPRAFLTEFIDGVDSASVAATILDDVASRAKAVGITAVTHSVKNEPEAGHPW